MLEFFDGTSHEKSDCNVLVLLGCLFGRRGLWRHCPQKMKCAACRFKEPRMGTLVHPIQLHEPTPTDQLSLVIGCI